MQAEQQYIDLYRECRQLICDHSSDVMNSHRDDAFERFCANGFPNRKVERYKYTDMQTLFEPNYGLNLSRLNIPVNPYDAFRCDVPNLSTSLYFVVNDQFYRGTTRNEEGGMRNEERGRRNEEGGMRNTRKLPEGVVITSLRDATQSANDSAFSTLNSQFSTPHSQFSTPHSQFSTPHSQFSTPHSPLSCYNRLAGADHDAVSDLNTMLAQDGLLVYVPKGVVIDRAVQVINILRADVDLMVNRRVLIILEEGAEAKLLFCDHAADDRRFLATQVIECFVGPQAKLDLYCLEETHRKCTRVSNVYIHQERDSRVNHNIITLHNGVTRNKLNVELAGEGAECSCNGCVIADKQQSVDNNTLITHHAPHCTSNELYKYVLNDESTGAFAGRVLVRPGAQQTVSQMTNQNLTATRQARMYTQPMLEIYADDVKCNHGSTVGQLNDAALFYMQQRGIPLSEARLLLQNAFINEVIDHMQLEPLRDRLHYLVEKRFRGELSKCEGCKLCK